MAQEIYKLGDIQFDSKEEFLAATKDLKRINDLMKEHDTKNPDEAKKLLAELGDDSGFTTDYGFKFIEKLKKTAAEGNSLTEDNRKTQPSHTLTNEEKVKNSADAKKAKENRAVKSKKKRGGGKVHVATRRNIIIVAIIAVLAAAVSLLMATGIIPTPDKWIPGLSFEMSEANSHKNLVLQYAKNQLTFREELISYYKSSQSKSSDEARNEANNVISNAYAMNLADENVPNMSDQEIEDIYKALMLAGDIEAGGFNEPTEITKLKSEIREVVSSGSANGNQSAEVVDATGEADSRVKKISSINQMMDYQERLSIQFACDYSHYKLKKDEIIENVSEDMEKLFATPIYNAILPDDENSVLSDKEKEMYYDSYLQTGQIDANGPVRFNSSPTFYNLPDLTSQIKMSFKNGFEATTNAAQQTLAPKAQVTYELLGPDVKGYVTFRANGTGNDYVQDDDDKTVVVQGDFYALLDNQITVGTWYYNSGKVGILVDDTRFGEIECVYNINY